MQGTVSGSGISWAICKSATRYEQITMLAPHHSSFLQAGCPSCCPTNSVNALKAKCSSVTKFETYFIHCAFYAALLVINTKQVQYVPPHYGTVNLCGQHFTWQQQLSIDICCPSSASNQPIAAAAVDG